MAKAAEETIFGDALPEASNGNIVTIILNPKHSDSLDDDLPQETHVQESRCIPTLGSMDTNLGEMRIPQKPPSLLRDIFGLPRINKPAGLSHRNLLDMDNGASNIQEQVVQADDNQASTKSVLRMRNYAPSMNIDKDIKNKFTNLKSNVDATFKKVPDFKLPSLKNKLKDLIANRSLIGKEKVNPLPPIPKMKLNNPLLKTKGKDSEDLSLSASNIHEKAKKSFFQTKSHLDNILQHSKPVGLKTLLKLKDVEFVPLKDLIPKAAERTKLTKPKFAWPNIFNKGDNVKLSNNDEMPLNVARSTEIIEKIPTFRKDETLDVEVSPSNAIEQIADNNCMNGPFKIAVTDGETTEAKAALTEVIDAASSPSEIKEIVSDTTNDFANSQLNELSNNADELLDNTDELPGNTDELPDNTDELPDNTDELPENTDELPENSYVLHGNIDGLPDNTDQLPGNTDDCNIKTLPDTETDPSESIETSIENEVQDNSEEEINFVTSKEITSDDAKVEEDSHSEFISKDEDCVSNINDGDSINESSNNINNILKPTDADLENIDDSLSNNIPETDKPCSQELPASDTANTFDIMPKTKLIKPISSLDQTLSSIKEKIAKHIEDLKNPKAFSEILSPQVPSDIMENKESSLITSESLDSDCQNEESIQVATVKPDKICDDDLKIENESDDDKVSMQDLQKLSDEMLQEEQERELKMTNCSETIQEVTDPNKHIDLNSGETENTDTEPSANNQIEMVMDPQNIVDIADKTESKVKDTCESDLTSPKQSVDKESDANVAASEVVIKRAFLNNDIIGSPFSLEKVLQPKENGLSFLNNPLPDIKDIKLPPLPTLDNFKLGFNNLFDKPARAVDEHLASEAASMTDTSNILAPIMSTDASAKYFKSLLPPLRLENVDLDILQLEPPSNLFSRIPKLDLHSFRTKLPLPTDLRIKPIKLQSAFEDKGGLLGATLSLGQNNPLGSIPSLDFGTQKIAKALRKPDSLRQSLKSSQGIGSSFRAATAKPVNLQTNDFLQSISRNHEDVSDKLRALHIDFNDRLETMRNNLFDSSIFGSGESRSTKSFTTFSTNNKDKKSSLKTSQPQSLSSRRESKKTLKPRRLEKQKDTRLGSSNGLQKKFKMPTAASVPVPRTIEVPELKATLAKSPGLGIQRASRLNPIFEKKEASQPKESAISLWKQASKKLPVTNTRLGKTINPFKDSKIKVSFSTTPRPTLSSRLQSKKVSTPLSSLTSNFGKNTGRLGQRLDHNGSPTEIKNSFVLPPISKQLDQQSYENYGMESESKLTGLLTTRKLAGKEKIEQPNMSKDLQSWPKVTESAFLSKVKEAVKARMSQVNSPVIFKQADGNSKRPSMVENGKILNTNTDMARSASTNIDVIEGQPLKENLSYKCTMVCTKE